MPVLTMLNAKDRPGKRPSARSVPSGKPISRLISVARPETFSESRVTSRTSGSEKRLLNKSIEVGCKKVDKETSTQGTESVDIGKQQVGKYTTLSTCLLVYFKPRSASVLVASGTNNCWPYLSTPN